MEVSSQILSDITVYMKYARFLDNEKRREIWDEAVTRNKQMHIKKYPELWEQIEEAYKFVYNKKVLPSMRSLQFGGKAIERNHARVYNCFAEETRFVTSEGVRSFEDFSDGDEVLVPTHKGSWKKAKVRSYGRQPLHELTFRRGRSEKRVRATKNHRWILREGETTSIAEGDVLCRTPDLFSDFDYHEASPEERLYWCYGYVYGDGTKVKDKEGNHKYSMVRLCGDDKNYKERFEEMGFKTSTSHSLDGDFVAYTGTYLKTRPDLKKDSFELIRAFVSGYADADAEKNTCQTNRNKYVSIQSSEQDHISFIREAFEVVGLFIQDEKDLTGEETNFGTRGETFKFSLANSLGRYANSSWSLSSISEDFREEEVWCLEVEGDHSFILSGGLVTGNCAYLPIDHPLAFAETMFLLLGGTGVGYSVQKHHVDQLPVIRKPTKRRRRFVIQDSIIGWADAIKVLMKAYFNGISNPEFDFSDIRPKGAPLKTAGGKAPGPEPLKLCIRQIKAILNEKEDGTQLSPLEVHDIVCHIADAVLAGGIRRAALISLFSADDEEMISCKYGNWWEQNPQRGRANNSAVLLRHKATEEFFFDLWKKIELSNAGEPGIYFSNDKDWGTNPSLRAGTKVLTTNGIYPIEKLQDTEFEVKNLNGEISKARCWLSGKGKKLYKLNLVGGHSYYATAEHEWAVDYGGQWTKFRTPDLRPGMHLPVLKEDKLFDGTEGSYEDGFVLGWQLGDSWVTERSDSGLIQHGFINENMEKFGATHKSNGLPHAVWVNGSEDFRKGLVDALFSSDGHVEKNKKRIVFTSKHEKLVSDLSELLGFYGIKNSIRTSETKLNGREFERYDLRITDGASIRHFRNLFKLSVGYKQEQLDAYEFPYNSVSKTIQVVSVEETELYEDVWDISVYDETHCFQISQCITGNCCEIALRPNQFCNLVEVNASNIETQKDLEERVRAASFIATLQAGYTDFHYLRPVWQRTTEKDALIGVSMTGIASKRLEGLDLKAANKVIKKENARVAELLGINRAARRTCLKPSGTTSLVLGSSSGIHAWHWYYYLRRIRVMKNEPIYQHLSVWHPELVEDDKLLANTACIVVPQKAPENAIIRNESAMDLLNRVKHFSQNWVKPGHSRGNNTHNISATVSIKEDEWGLVGDWMWENREYYNGLSVIPYDGGTYTQAPFTDCSREEYEELMKSLRAVDLTRIIEVEDNTALKEELACAGGSCTITSF